MSATAWNAEIRAAAAINRDDTAQNIRLRARMDTTDHEAIELRINGDIKHTEITMGAWGYKPFENDTSLDARARVRNHIEAKLRYALRKQWDDEEALGYVAMLVLLKEEPSTEEFGAYVLKKMTDNFNAPTITHRRIPRQPDGRVSKLVAGSRGDAWDNPKKRFAVIRSTIMRWIGLART